MKYIAICFPDRNGKGGPRPIGCNRRTQDRNGKIYTYRP